MMPSLFTNLTYLRERYLYWTVPYINLNELSKKRVNVNSKRLPDVLPPGILPQGVQDFLGGYSYAVLAGWRAIFRYSDIYTYFSHILLFCVTYSLFIRV